MWCVSDRTHLSQNREFERRSTSLLRYGEAYGALEREVSESAPDPRATVTLLRALGIVNMEEIRRSLAEMFRMEVATGDFLRLRALVGLGFPKDCDDRQRSTSPAACTSVFDFQASVFAAIRAAHKDATLADGRRAKTVVNLCALSPPSDDYASKLVLLVDGPSATSALVFAGLPYARDSRVYRGGSGAVSSDFLTLVGGTGALVAAIHVRKTYGNPWERNLVESGLVSLALNVAIKAGRSIGYWHHYAN